MLKVVDLHPAEEFFLLAGGEELGRDSSAAIETRIPCQYEKAFLKFE